MKKKLIAAAVMLALANAAWAVGGGADSTSIVAPTLNGDLNQGAGAATSGCRMSSCSPYDPPWVVALLAPIEGPIVSNFVPVAPQGQLQSGTGEPVVSLSLNGGQPELGTIGSGGSFNPGTGTGGQVAALTAVNARAYQTYSMFTPASGPSVPDMTTLTPSTSAEAQVFSSAEASQGTGTTINNAADAAAHIASTYGVNFHSDSTTGIYWGYQDGANPDANSLYVDAGKHYIFGPPVTNMPTSGTATYTLVGSTVPSITLAGSASSGSGSGNSFTSGNFTANFSAQTLTTPAMAMNFAANGNIPALTLSMAAGQTIAYGGANTAQNIAVACSGGCTTSVTGNINTRFTGNGASGLAVAITAYGGSVPVTMSGTTINAPISAAVVAAYKKQ